ncbi:MAG: MotA/TolQ/ExbB proton channel family protein [Candidatus Rokubacteria bacterium]|nr:MotA/TolQ/ExbB proton channel family protein [Candidatus Rokubacteria bacterium]
MPGAAALASPGILELVWSAGPVAKFVLALLCLFSVVCWALIVEKWWEFRKIHRETMRFLKAFRDGRRHVAAFSAARRHPESPLASIYIAGCQEAVGTTGNPELADRALDEADDGLAEDTLESANRAMRRAASAEISRMERYLPFLATTATSAPFIGLFGTVWGVMSAFHGIGAQGSASLAVVAPGISEALVATAAGLGAAIPAVMGYNYFVNRVKQWAAEMDEFILDLLNVFARPQPKPARVGKDGL